jgi:hypothetical protein
MTDTAKAQVPVTRYWTTCEDGIHGLDPAPKGLGNWVRYADYVALEAQVARLREALGLTTDEEWIALCSGDHVEETDVQRRDVDALLSARAQKAGI